MEDYSQTTYALVTHYCFSIIHQTEHFNKTTHMLNKRSILQYTIIIIAFILLLNFFSPLDYTFKNNMEIPTKVRHSLHNLNIPFFRDPEFDPNDESFNKSAMIRLVIELLILVPIFIII